MITANHTALLRRQQPATSIQRFNQLWKRYKLETQKLLQLGRGRMNIAFHPEGRILLIANHDAGSLAVADLEQAEVLRTVPAGVGVETSPFIEANMAEWIKTARDAEAVNSSK
jgi:hypothetical protein